MNRFTLSDDLFKFANEDESQSQPSDQEASSSKSSSTKFHTATKNWAENLQEKYRDFTPSNSNSMQRSFPLRTVGHVTTAINRRNNDNRRSLQLKPVGHLNTDVKGNKSKWVGNPTRLIQNEDEIIIDSPSKYQAIECDETSSESDTDDRNSISFLKTSIPTLPTNKNQLWSEPGPSRLSKNVAKTVDITKPRRFPIFRKQLDFENQDVTIELVRSPESKLQVGTQSLSLSFVPLKSVVPFRKSTSSLQIPNCLNESPKRKASYLIEFTTPERNQTVVPNSDAEEDFLESAILDVESPAKQSPRKFIINKPLLLLSESEPSDLSGHISEIESSTQSSGTSALLDRTPIAQWIHKGKHDTMPMDLDISEFDSPKKSERLQACSELNSEHWTVVGGRRRKKRGLADQIRGIVSRYDSSVRMFSHDLRSGKFDEDLAMPLVIRAICGREDKHIWTICYDIKAKDNRCIVFKPQYPQEIILGAKLKLYQPWKQINLPGVNSPVICCADFYKVIQKLEDLHIGVTKEFLEQLRCTPVNNLKSFRTISAEELKPTFFSLIPYSVKNKNTITKQANRFQSFVNLDIVIQCCWPSKKGQTVLISDSDRVFALLYVPDSNEELQHVITRGRYIKFRKLGINSKISIFKDSSLFSVLRVYGSKQVFYYNLGLRLDTEWNSELHLEIPFGNVDCQRRFIHEIRQMHPCQDERVAVECLIQSRTKNYIKVIDNLGGKMTVNLLYHFGSSEQMFSSLIPKKQVLLNFLRLFNDAPALDHFSIVEVRSGTETYNGASGNFKCATQPNLLPTSNC